jgi:hypothetical protein
MQTDLGNEVARSVEMEKAAVTIENSTVGFLKQ